MVGSSQRPKVPAISVNGPQSRPASFHTPTRSTDQRSNSGVYLQQNPPRQPIQQTSRSGEWVPGVIPRQNLQQSHAQFMALEKEFQNLVKSSSPNHSRHDSFDSAISTRSSYSRPSSATSQSSSGPADMKDAPLHGARRNYTSSPLAKPTRPSVDTTASSNSPTHKNGPPATAVPSSKKHTRGESKSSRLRRVLSIGSLDNVSKSGESVAESQDGKDTKWGEVDGGQEHGSERPHTPNREHGIYGSNIFSRSLESIAASTKASSASAMIKKVGSGVRRGSRSLSGLFRPKSPSPLVTEVSQPAVSMVTVEAETPIVKVSQPAVSMVTVEAETPLVKGPLPPKVSEAFPTIGLGSPKASFEHEVPKIPERNRSDSLSPPEDPKAQSMGLIRGTSPIPKGILKGSASPDLRPTSRKEVPTFSDVFSSPSPSVPSTPTNEAQDSRMLNPFLTGDFTSDLTSDLDGLMEALNRVNGIDEPIEAVQAVQAVAKPKHHTSFSPRLVFYETWTPEEYDRRGEVATCNLLTPKLAQQIKEEINTFKLEMDVHETSKMYTQFH
ncbi:unnamed protein product [Clonostachys byssicola]|uniref:Uncharacterized protein n=1 Tax=Clonostachys byssicola TaxID=160290 RepID=A0A9N9XV89_9HYPO|nr:unnamed protein product [Clonostachys byssicola]